MNCCVNSALWGMTTSKKSQDIGINGDLITNVVVVDFGANN